MLRPDAMLQVSEGVEEVKSAGECRKCGKRQILVVPPPNSAETVPEAFTATLPGWAAAIVLLPERAISFHSTFTYDVQVSIDIHG